MGAIQHKGFALLDIISPCVTFNNHESSTKSYDYIRNHNEAMGKTDFVPLGQEIETDYEEGSTVEVKLHDGSRLSLEKTDQFFPKRVLIRHEALLLQLIPLHSQFQFLVLKAQSQSFPWLHYDFECNHNFS